MSWDIFVQDLPKGITCVEDISDDFVPVEIGLRSEVSNTIRSLYPEAVVQSEDWMVLDLPACSLEINLGDSEELSSFAFHIRGGDAAPLVVAHILESLGLRAFDPQAESGLFDATVASASLTQWQAYRSRVVAGHS